jgi:hypothetical protein
MRDEIGKIFRGSAPASPSRYGALGLKTRPAGLEPATPGLEGGSRARSATLAIVWAARPFGGS